MSYSLYPKTAAVALDEQNDDQRARRLLLKRQIFHALFYLGTLLAVVGWYVDTRGPGTYANILLRLSVLALVGHALQVVAVFALLILPDASELDHENSHDDSDRE